jgi:hypothetical protein
MGTITCRFCACRIAWFRARTEAPFYFIGDELEPRHTCKAEACLARAGAEIVADEARRVAA